MVNLGQLQSMRDSKTYNVTTYNEDSEHSDAFNRHFYRPRKPQSYRCMLGDLTRCWDLHLDMSMMGIDQMRCLHVRSQVYGCVLAQGIDLGCLLQTLNTAFERAVIPFVHDNQVIRGASSQTPYAAVTLEFLYVGKAEHAD